MSTLAAARQTKGLPDSATRRLDVSALMGHHLRPLQVPSDWFAVQGRDVFLCQRNVHGELTELRTSDGGELRKRAIAIWPQLPPRAAIRDAVAAIETSLSQRVPERESRMLLGALMAGLRARMTDDAPIAIDVLVYVVDESPAPISGTLLAAGIRRIWRNAVFAPTPKELLDAVEAERTSARYLRGRLASFLDFADGVEDLLIETGGQPDDHYSGDSDGMDDAIPF